MKVNRLNLAVRIAMVTARPVIGRTRPEVRASKANTAQFAREKPKIRALNQERLSSGSRCGFVIGKKRGQSLGIGWNSSQGRSMSSCSRFRVVVCLSPLKLREPSARR